MLFHLMLVTLAFITTQSNAADVFLGGSCNPTTWRKDIVIPKFNDLKISYYNPQVDNWSEELKEIEAKEKGEAKVLFFVLDKQTRALASIVEVAYLAGTRSNVVLVLDKFPESGCKIAISDPECKNLAAGRLIVKGMIEKNEGKVYEDYQTAIEFTAEFLKKNTGLPIPVIYQDKLPGRPEPGGVKQLFIVGVDSKPSGASAVVTWTNGQDTEINDQGFKSEVIMFVIDKKSVNVRVMALASYFMGLGGFKIVLVLEDFAGAGPEAYQKDYNRGRSYLQDAANLLCVPTYDKLDEALTCAGNKLANSCTDVTKLCCTESKDPHGVFPDANGDDDGFSKRMAVMIGIIAGAILLVSVLGASAYMFVGRRRRRGGRSDESSRSGSRSSKKASSRTSLSSSRKKSSHA